MIYIHNRKAPIDGAPVLRAWALGGVGVEAERDVVVTVGVADHTIG